MTISIVGKERALSQLLCRLPEIVDHLGAKQPKAPESFMVWLKDAETCLEDHRVAQASAIAAVRSKLIALQYTKSTRKDQQRLCCEVLPEAQQVLALLHEEVSQPIKDARKLLAPLLSAVAQSGGLTYANGESYQVFIEKLSHLLNSHEQLKSSMVHVNALLPAHDCLWLLGDMVDLELWSMAPV